MSAVDENLLKAWLALNHADEESAEYDELFWSFEKVNDLCTEEPDEAWAFILAAWNADQSEPAAGSLSAGPLEDLLAKHGSHVIERVEAEARVNPSFAFLLGGVWKNAMSDEIWSRVKAVRDRRGWDGIPSAQQGAQTDGSASGGPAA